MSYMKRRRQRRKKSLLRKPNKKLMKKAEKVVMPGRKKKKPVLLKPIEDIARSVGIKKKFLETYGLYKAKVSLGAVGSRKLKKGGKYVLITSITPSPFGEGKTVTAVGLAMAFKKLKKRAIACVTQPALGGVFGMKGVGTGGGLAQIYPREDANLHLTGDTHAVMSAHNLCAAYLDNSIYTGNALDIDPVSITWRRVLDTNDRALRNMNTGLGGKADGISRKTGFETVASSELMAILALANNLKDLRERIGRIIVAFNKKGKPVTCEDIKVAGAMTVLLKDAIKPNLLQAQDGSPCLMHTGSFANISIGTSSVIADRLALKHCDYVIAEAGFGADTGAEKFFNIKCRAGEIVPDVIVLVASVRAFKMHSGEVEISAGKPLPREILRENVFAVEKGLSNLEKQVENLQVFGVPIVVCINRFNEDGEKEIAAIKKRAMRTGVGAVVVSSVYRDGAEGGIELAQAVIAAAKTKSNFRFLYPIDISLKDKINRIAKTIYGAGEVKFSDLANKKIPAFKKLKLDTLPVCILKTHLSLSHNPKRKGRPHNFKLPVTDLEICAGAGFVAVYCENAKMMPSLPKVPRGAKIDIDEEGKITGLF